MRHKQNGAPMSKENIATCKLNARTIVTSFLAWAIMTSLIGCGDSQNTKAERTKNERVDRVKAEIGKAQKRHDEDARKQALKEDALRQQAHDAVMSDAVRCELEKWTRAGDSMVFLKLHVTNGTPHTVTSLKFSITATDERGITLGEGVSDCSQTITAFSSKTCESVFRTTFHTKLIWKIGASLDGFAFANY